MRKFYLRPLGCVCAFFILGTAIAGYLPYNFMSLLIASSAITAVFFTVLFLVFKNEKSKGRLFLSFSIILASFLVGFSLTFFRVRFIQREYSEKYIEKTETVIATVTKRNLQTDYLSVYVISVKKIGDKHVHFNASLESEFSADFSVGEIICTDVTIKEYVQYDSSVQSRLHAKSENIIFTFVPTGTKIEVIGNSHSPLILLSKFRARLSADIKRISVRDKSGLIPALLLGDRTVISDSVKRDFNRLGISHILAVSGMHLSIVISSLGYLLGKFGLSIRLKKLIPISAVILFAVVTGLSMSVLRASFMALLCFCGAFFGRKNDPLTSLFFAVTIILVITPTAVYDIGLILSFTSTLGIVTIGYMIFDYAEMRKEKRNEKRKKNKQAEMPYVMKLPLIVLRFFTDTVIISASALFFSLPILILFFDEVSVFSFTSNIIFLPLTELILYIAPFTFVFPVLPKTAFFFGNVASGIANFTVSLASRISSKITVVLNVFDAVVPFLFALCIFLYILIFLGNKNKKVAIALFAVISVLLLPIFTLASDFDFSTGVSLFYYTDAEENTVPKSANEFLILKSSQRYGFSDKIILCDISDGRYSSYMNVMKCLKSDIHESDVDSLILTHYHTKHLTTLPKLFDAYYVHKLYLPIPQNDEEYKSSLQLADIAFSHGVKVVYISPSIKANADKADEYLSLIPKKGFEIISCFTENDITLKLSGNSYIDRSSHPVISLLGGAYTDDGRYYTFAYEGGAYSEADFSDEYELAVLQSNFKIYGLHSPVSHDENYNPAVVPYSADGFSIKAYYKQKQK